MLPATSIDYRCDNGWQCDKILVVTRFLRILDPLLSVSLPWLEDLIELVECFMVLLLLQASKTPTSTCCQRRCRRGWGAWETQSSWSREVRRVSKHSLALTSTAWKSLRRPCLVFLRAIFGSTGAGRTLDRWVTDDLYHEQWKLWQNVASMIWVFCKLKKMENSAKHS